MPETAWTVTFEIHISITAAVRALSEAHEENVLEATASARLVST